MEPQKNASYNGLFIFPNTMADLNKPMACSPNGTLWRAYSMGWAMNDDPLNRSLSALLIQLTAFITLSRALYFILRPLRQPRIICDFIGGVILGSSGLQRNEDFDPIIYPIKYVLNLRTLSSYAVVHYIFLLAVKTDPLMMVRYGMKAVIICTSSVLLPVLVVTASCLYLGGNFDIPIFQGSFVLFLGAIVSITSYPGVGDILAELNLLNTEIGRLGLSSAVISDVFGWFAISVLSVVNKNQRSHKVYAVLAMVSMLLFIVIFGWVARWIVQKTPNGAQVHEGYLNAIMLSVIGVTLISGTFGSSILQGPVFLGLMVPHGPPLGSALEQRMELIANEVLMPIFFLNLGNSLIIPEFQDWVTLWMPLILMVILGYATKMAATILAAFYCRIPLRKATMLALILNFRGVVELAILTSFNRRRLLDEPSFAVLVLLSMLSTAIAVPLVSFFYDPLALNTRGALGRRTIQHLRENAEALILVCVHNDDPVPAIINVLEASNAESVSSMCVYVLHLVELVGRTSSTLVAHKNKKGYVNPSRMDRLLNQFINFEQDKHGMVSVLPYTTVAPYKSMHQDICSLAVEKKVVFILVPYPRKDVAAGATPADHAMRASVIPEILTMAPCSVGILVHHGLCAPPLPSSSFWYDIGLLFWGGPHDREALIYASRMARHPGVTVKVTRFVPSVDMREDTERLLDDQVVEDFKISHCKKDKVTFKELALDIEETMSALRTVVSMGHDLIIVGREQGANCYLNDALAEWSECPELGVVGDMLASSDIKCPSLILIVQQQRQWHKLEVLGG